MTNMLKMIKDAVLAQKNLKKIQNELQQKTFEYSSAGGGVRVTACGDASVLSIKIEPSAVAPNRIDKLEKMILEAVNGALAEAKKMSAEHMQKLMADMGLPRIN